MMPRLLEYVLATLIPPGVGVCVWGHWFPILLRNTVNAVDVSTYYNFEIVEIYFGCLLAATLAAGVAMGAARVFVGFLLQIEEEP